MARLSGRGGHDFKLNWSIQTFFQIDGLIMTFINIIVKKICLKCSSTEATDKKPDIFFWFVSQGQDDSWDDEDLVWSLPSPC